MKELKNKYKFSHIEIIEENEIFLIFMKMKDNGLIKLKRVEYLSSGFSGMLSEQAEQDLKDKINQFIKDNK